MNNFKNRKELYKSPRGSPPAWKDTYRKKCFESLRARRASLIEQFRFSNTPSKLLSESSSPSKIVSDVMEVEWNTIHQSRSFPSLICTKSSSISLEDSDEEVMREVLLEIQNELQNEDLLLNEIVQYDSNDLKSKVEMFEMNEVICPICKVRNLEEQGLRKPPDVPENAFQTPPKLSANPVSVLKCRCGFVLSGLHLTLTRVHSALQNTVRSHERTCLSALHFSATEAGDGLANVLVTCSACDWMTFLL